MTPRASVQGLWAHVCDWPLWCLGGITALLFVLVGCQSSGQHRAKAEDDSELQRYDIATIGDRTTVGNAAPLPLGGVGLVEGLEGTGGDCNHDSYRAMLVKDLEKDRVPNIPALLKSTDHALVIVEAQIPPGANRGDLVDVEIKLPPGTRATSLRGGILRKSYLFNYDFAKNLRPDYQGGNQMFMGHKRAVAKGPIIVGTGDGDEATRVKSGKIWAGARLLADQPLALVMNQDSQQGRFTSLIMDRVNASFQESSVSPGLDSRLAYTKNQYSIDLRVPQQYRHNLPRYLRVVRVIPLTEMADAPGKTEADRRSYRQKLGDDLLDPSRTIIAALRLEALGAKSIPILKDKGLRSEHALVRFASAEALAYLGHPSCAEELYKAAVSTPLLRAYALTALASLDEAICHIKLKELVTSNLDDQVRYGAFRGLQMLNENDPLVKGELLNDSFWLHRVAANTKPFVHILTSKRAEVVLAGETPTFKPPFSFLANEFAITATKGDDRCTVSRFPLHSAPARKQCSLVLEDVIRTMADLGAHYPEVVALLQQATSCNGLSCRLLIDALPQAADIRELVQAGKDPSEMVPGGQDLGQTPTLFNLSLSTQGTR